MQLLHVLLFFYAALVASIPTANSNAELISDSFPDTLAVVCKWDWDCPHQQLCCKGRCHRTGDCKHVPPKPEVIGNAQTCTWATDCRPGDLCCNGYCQSVYDCRRVPPKPPIQDPEATTDDKETPETPDEAEPAVDDRSETQHDKRRYRSPEDRSDDKASEEPGIQGVPTDAACKQWWDCGVSGEHQWMCCNGKCLKWYPGSTPWIRPKCLK
ncbi:hypothetical protein ABOM_003230 [Aspergillus bombycis]|uniref:Uncharacterized protein n=1 Tax=Aspergillus bombycis TaxID=109264 RepID=A0A1F8A8S5_9EURO|nr:hypothetical protein ABOM_003230 [Aspergillus bombycis]OGM47765.1 hypothetical protein ABOM_003230 [Aspergillus bombycis]